MPDKINLTINSRKLDQTIQRSWQCALLERKNSLYILQGVFDKQVNHPQIGVIRRGTVSTEYFWLDRWYNIFRFETASGDLIGFYCNVNMPPRIDETEINYVDLDLDVFVDSQMSVHILDSDEFVSNAKKYNYSEEILLNAKRAIREVIKMIEAREFPFNISSKSL